MMFIGNSRFDILCSSSDVMWSIILQLVMNFVALFFTFCMLLICDRLLVCSGIAGYRSLDIVSIRKSFLPCFETCSFAM